MAPRESTRTLRITESPESAAGKYNIHLRLEGAGRPLDVHVPLAFELSEKDRDDLRWYLETFLRFPQDPATQRAAGVEHRMAEVGDSVAEAIFSKTEDARRLWDRARDDLADTRVEVLTEVVHAASIPWELMRDPLTKRPLALETRAFVRGHPMPKKFAPELDTSGGPIRVLLVICRPLGNFDVPFRMVAKKLVEGLDRASCEWVHLDVLRPPTFEQLSRVLRDAKDQGKPYHVVHFDGHGDYTDNPETSVSGGGTSVGVEVIGRKPGPHGYLRFENDNELSDKGITRVGAKPLGNLLMETGVSVLVLNACRSAYAEPADEEQPTDELRDIHEDISRFGSLALELIDAGVLGVVAMRYNVYTVTAAEFVAELYGALLNGQSLGEAVSRGRKQLEAQPLRNVGAEPRPLQDWCVPVVYEVQPLVLFSTPISHREVNLVPGGEPQMARGTLVDVPHAPGVGFVGRDETLLALDRAFDKHSVVVLHAYAGSGKTTTAAEFARWYAQTGGIEGPVLWTSFAQKILLSRVLDAIAKGFKSELKKNSIEWGACSEEERKSIALRLLAGRSVLWVWDNVELVAGFPSGTPSAWSTDEQAELLDFLQQARQTKAKFLLTSRRDEQAWLDELPARIRVPAMPMPDREELARALASKRGVRFADVQGWRPLLSFSQGNPLTITVVVSQVLRDVTLRKHAEIQAFVGKLRAGEQAFDDDETQGRSRSLGASLRYGFDAGFAEADQKRLALLHLFQGFVDVDALRIIGDPIAPWCLPEVNGVTREQGMVLLDRAAEMGLLTGHGSGYYSIHPAVPWFFRDMFDTYYPEVRTDVDGSNALQAKRAYVEVMGGLGNVYHKLYGQGHRNHLVVLEVDEPNMLHARMLARHYEWWARVIGTMQGLHVLYDHTGRHLEWARLVNEIKHEFVDAFTDGPRSGLEEEWSIINSYRVQLAIRGRQWAEASRLHDGQVRLVRAQAKDALALPAAALTGEQRHRLRTLAALLHGLGDIQRDTGSADCIVSYVEAIDMARLVNDRARQVNVAINLGHAYRTLPTVRNLDEAEWWCRHGLELCGDDLPHGRAQCLINLGCVMFERFQSALADNQPDKVRRVHINAARQFYLQALDLLPRNAVGDLSVIHHSLGNIEWAETDLNSAIEHYEHAIGYMERSGNVYRAGQTRINVAVTFAQSGRLDVALLYAQAALRDFKTFGDGAADDVAKTQQLIAELERTMTPQ